MHPRCGAGLRDHARTGAARDAHHHPRRARNDREGQIAAGRAAVRDPEIMTDRIRMKGIEFVGVHGATDVERIRSQRFSVDLTLELPLARVAKTERIEDAVDYRDLGTMVIRFGTSAKYHLLETLAANIADEVQ